MFWTVLALRICFQQVATATCSTKKNQNLLHAQEQMQKGIPALPGLPSCEAETAGRASQWLRRENARKESDCPWGWVSSIWVVEKVLPACGSS
jgi:hypothetical protein